MSICTWSMKLRFQIGSKSPLAKRKARMFWAASLPRKWSIRKTCDSSKVWWTRALRSIAEARSVPNGFSITTRARVDEVGVAEHLDHRQRRLRRHRQVVEAAYVVAERLLRRRDRGGQGLGTGGLRDVGEVVVEVVPLLGRELLVGELLDRGAGELPELGVVHVLQRGADDADLGSEVGDDEVGHARAAACAGRGRRSRRRGRSRAGPSARARSARTSAPRRGRRWSGRAAGDDGSVTGRSWHRMRDSPSIPASKELR